MFLVLLEWVTYILTIFRAASALISRGRPVVYAAVGIAVALVARGNTGAIFTRCFIGCTSWSRQVGKICKMDKMI